jgi:hypothetical protein
MVDDDKPEDMFDWAEAHARSTDPWTSHAAAKETDACESERLVWEMLWETGAAMTTYELSEAIGKAEGSITPRMKPLERKGLVIRCGHKMGPRGSSMTLWKGVRSSPLATAAAAAAADHPTPGSSGVAQPQA